MIPKFDKFLYPIQEYLLALVCVLVMWTGNTSVFATKPINVRFEPDTLSVIKNPCTGWSIYTDGYIPASAEAYYNEMEKCGALAYANSLYIRLPWALLEPEEGKYAWVCNEEFKKLIEGAKQRNIKLAFRVYYDNKDYRIPVSPRYLIEAGAKGYQSNTNFWTPYADDPVFLQKLDKFLEAMGKEFNDPEITDYVDGCGLGTWGEGFNAVYLDKKNKDDVLYTVARSYARHFNKVIVAINAHSDMGIPPLRTLADVDDIVFRHDAIGSRVWFEPSQSQLMMDYFPHHFTIAESMWWLSQGPNTSIFTNEDFHSWREVMDFTYEEAKRIRANILDLRNVPEASTLWMTMAQDLVDSFNRQAGYRLTPVEVSCPGSIIRGKNVTIRHTWRNSGWGVCPNNNTHWNHKYKVAFALIPLGSDTPAEVIVDEHADPSEWLKEHDTDYVFTSTFSHAPKGRYRLAIGVVDKSLNHAVGLNLAVANAMVLSTGWLPMGEVRVR